MVHAKLYLTTKCIIISIWFKYYMLMPGLSVGNFWSDQTYLDTFSVNIITMKYDHNNWYVPWLITIIFISIIIHAKWHVITNCLPNNDLSLCGHIYSKPSGIICNIKKAVYHPSYIYAINWSEITHAYPMDSSTIHMWMTPQIIYLFTQSEMEHNDLWQGGN